MSNAVAMVFYTIAITHAIVHGLTAHSPPGLPLTVDSKLMRGRCKGMVRMPKKFMRQNGSEVSGKTRKKRRRYPTFP